jgi:hypothetical protein
MTAATLLRSKVKTEAPESAQVMECPIYGAQHQPMARTNMWRIEPLPLRAKYMRMASGMAIWKNQFFISTDHANGKEASSCATSRGCAMRKGGGVRDQSLRRKQSRINRVVIPSDFHTLNAKPKSLRHSLLEERPRTPHLTRAVTSASVNIESRAGGRSVGGGGPSLRHVERKASADVKMRWMDLMFASSPSAVTA